MTCSVQKFLTLSKFFFWSFQNEQFQLKNIVLQDCNTYKKESIMDQNQNPSIDQIWGWGCGYLFQSKYTFKIPTFLHDSKQTKFWQPCLFFFFFWRGKTWRLLPSWLSQSSMKKKWLSHVGRRHRSSHGHPPHPSIQGMRCVWGDQSLLLLHHGTTNLTVLRPLRSGDAVSATARTLERYHSQIFHPTWRDRAWLPSPGPPPPFGTYGYDLRTRRVSICFQGTDACSDKSDGVLVCFYV